MPKCIICGEDFEAKRSDALLCSARCRQQAKRGGIKLRRHKDPIAAPVTEIATSPPIEPYVAQDQLLKPSDMPRKFEGISRIFHVPKEEMDKRIAEGIERVKVGMAQLAAYPTDYNDLLRLAKTGVPDQVTFKRHVDSLKLTPNQRSMIYSKLKLFQ